MGIGLMYSMIFKNLWFLVFVVISVACQRPALHKEPDNKTSPVVTEAVNYQRQNYYPVKLEPPYSIIDEDDVPGMPVANFCVVDDKLFFTGSKGHLIAADADDLGADHIDLSEAISAAPSFRYPLLLVASEVEGPGLLAYHILSGQIVWTHNPGPSVNAPVILGDQVYHTNLSRQIMQLDLASGSVTGTLKLDEQPVSHLAVHDKKLITTSTNGQVLSITAQNNLQVQWKKKIARAFRTYPVINGNHIYVATYDGKFIVIDTDGSMIYERDAGVSLYTAVSTDESSIFLPQSNGYLVAIDALSFKTLWKTKLDGPMTIPALVTRDHIVAGTSQKKLFFIKKENGQIIQELDIEGRLSALPVRIEEKLYIGYEYNHIAALIPDKDVNDDQ
ncbi:MAG: PQQ-binding-like beta-propeller repeat protein [Caldithrix sp.]|nr:PQQ-binding-like beta-propeller repeat protein [Caldithrix sp.]